MPFKTKTITDLALLGKFWEILRGEKIPVQPITKRVCITFEYTC